MCLAPWRWCMVGSRASPSFADISTVAVTFERTGLIGAVAARFTWKETSPLSQKEMGRIVAACETIYLQVGTNTELLAFVLLLRYSGLRIGDASMLTTDRFVGNDLFLYTAKSGTHVCVPLPPYLIELNQEDRFSTRQVFIRG